MKKNILDEMGVKVLRQVLMGENSLLLYKENEKDKTKVDICVRFIEYDSIKEHHIVTLPKDKLFIGLMEFSRDGKAIAIYKEVPEGFQLQRVYDMETHSFGISDFLDLEYKKSFPYNELSPQFIKKRGTNNGKHQN
jgi:hypothetical protein